MLSGGWHVREPRPEEPWQAADVCEGVSLHLAVRSIARSMPFYEQVLQMRCLHSDEDLAALAGHGLRLTLYAESASAVAQLPRGKGIEIRVGGLDPSGAARAALACGGDVLAGPRVFSHGWHASRLADPDGYVFVVGEHERQEPQASGGVRLRALRSDDADVVLPLLDLWWGGRHIAPRLPRLFFEYFGDASLAAEDGESRQLLGFLCGFFATGDTEQAYIHFVGVDPAARKRGIGRLLYEAFFAAARAGGRRSVTAITSPVNRASIAFHQALGFAILPGDAVELGTPVHTGREGPGSSHVVFRREI